MGKIKTNINKTSKIIGLIIFIFLFLLLILLCVLNFTDKGRSFLRLYNSDNKKIENYFQSYKNVYNDKIKMFSDINDYKNKRKPTVFKVNKKIKSSEPLQQAQYTVLNDLCNLGNIKKMYIPRQFGNIKSIKDNQLENEKRLAKKLKVKPGGKILDIGCGCGRIAHNIYNLTKCKVYGINIDEVQLDDARKYSRGKNPNEFFFLDLNDNYPFPDNYFDAIYSVQAITTFIQNYDKLYKELYRVLKPGGILFFFDAVLLDYFDGRNQYHLKLFKNSMEVMSAGNSINYYKYYQDYAIKNGFVLLSSSGGKYPNLALDLQPLKNEHANFQHIEDKIKFMTKCKLLPKKLSYLIDRLRFGADDLIEMLEKNMLTMCWEFHFQKPFKNKNSILQR